MRSRMRSAVQYNADGDTAGRAGSHQTDKFTS